MSASPNRIAVVGSGTWGTAVTGLLAPKAGEVVLWCRDAAVAEAINATGRNPRHLPDYTLAANVRATADITETVSGADAVVLAVPSAYLDGVCAGFSADAPVLVLTKGLNWDSGAGCDKGTGVLSHPCFVLDVAADRLGEPDRMAVLSGPNHAEEICAGKVSAAVVASNNQQVAAYFQELLVCEAFRVYTSTDVVGVEVCGATKNVIAIACGVAAGLGCGDNTLAVLMTRGLAEIARLAAALGADPLTPMGLAGMGDLVATCTSRHSRNRSFGEALVEGETLEGYEARTHMVVEGARAASSVLELANEHQVDVPVTRAVDAVLHHGLPVHEAIDALLGRTPRGEFYGIQV